MEEAKSEGEWSDEDADLPAQIQLVSFGFKHGAPKWTHSNFNIRLIG